MCIFTLIMLKPHSILFNSLKFFKNGDYVKRCFTTAACLGSEAKIDVNNGGKCFHVSLGFFLHIQKINNTCIKKDSWETYLRWLGKL